MARCSQFCSAVKIGICREPRVMSWQSRNMGRDTEIWTVMSLPITMGVSPVKNSSIGPVAQYNAGRVLKTHHEDYITAHVYIYLTS